MQWSRMADVGVDDETDIVTCRDGKGLGCWRSRVEFVARHGLGGDIGDGAVRVAVFGQPDGFPFAGFDAIVNSSSEGVCNDQK